MDAETAFQHTPPRELELGGLGKRAASLVSRRRGKYSRHRLARRGDTDVAIDGTLRAAAVRSGARQTTGTLRPLLEDLRRKVRSHRSPLAVVFIVDNSYSLHADRMVEKVKGLALGLLEDATHRGDRVALVAFKGGTRRATVVLPLTRSRRLAQQRLAEIPLASVTPLADALVRARRILRQERVKNQNAVPAVVLVSDCLPTAPRRRGGDPMTETMEQARRLRLEQVVTIVVDTHQPGATDRGCGPELARVAGGSCIPFATLAPGSLEPLPGVPAP